MSKGSAKKEGWFVPDAPGTIMLPLEWHEKIKQVRELWSPPPPNDAAYFLTRFFGKEAWNLVAIDNRGEKGKGKIFACSFCLPLDANEDDELERKVKALRWIETQNKIYDVYFDLNNYRLAPVGSCL